LFAPVYLQSNIYGQPGFVYSPAYAINPAIFASSLFLRPNYGHYYFGDYYGPNYAGAGFYPWFSFNNQFQNGYDPIFASQRWQNRNDRGWEQNLETQFERRHNNESARPPRTLADQNTAGTSTRVADAAMIALPVAMLANGKGNEMRLQKVDLQQRKELANSAKRVHDFREQRQKLESGATHTEASSSKKEPAREKLPRSPIVAHAAEHLDKTEAPPPKHEPPKPDPNAERRTTKAGAHGQTPPGEKSTNRGVAGTPSNEEPKAKPEPPKAAAPKGPAPKPEAPKAEPPKSAPPKAPPPKPEAPKAEPPPPKPAKPEPKKP
jgi:hypothetical protein